MYVYIFNIFCVLLGVYVRLYLIPERSSHGQTLGQSEEYQNGQAMDRPEMKGRDDFLEGEDQEEEKEMELAKVNLEEAGVFQDQVFDNKNVQKHVEEVDDEDLMEGMEATDPGAAGQLTGPSVAPRQEQ